MSEAPPGPEPMSREEFDKVYDKQHQPGGGTPEEIEADRILREGRPFKYLLDTFQKDHEGDLTAARCLALVFASGSVINGDGLHALISGTSGRGKSHSARMMYTQLPDRYKCNKRFSDKHLYYMAESGGINEGAVILIDDETLSETIQELLKWYTSEYNKGIQYGTVYQQKSKELNLPARISWVILKTDQPGDDQVMNRLIQCRVDESEDKVRASARKIQEKYRNLKDRTVGKDRREVVVCQEIWRRVKAEPVAVEVPCAGSVRFADYDNLRNHEIFFNILMAHTAIHRWQRKQIGTTEDGYTIIEATKDDYKEAKDIFEALFTYGGQKHNTLTNEDKVARALLKMNPSDGVFTIREVAAITELPYKSIWRALHGRNGGKAGDGLGGLLEKCPAIQSKGRRGQYELEISRSDRYESGEIIRKEHFNEEVFAVNLDKLQAWLKSGEPVWLEGFKWKGKE